MRYVKAQLLTISIAVFILSISLTVSAIEECGKKLGFLPHLEFAESKRVGGIINHAIVATDPSGKVIGKIDYRLENSDQKLFITYVTRDDSARNAGLPKAMFEMILSRHPDVQQVDANLMQVNAAVVDRRLFAGQPLEKAIFQSPTGKMLYELGFRKILILKDYSFFLEGSYHLLVSR